MLASTWGSKVSLWPLLRPLDYLEVWPFHFCSTLSPLAVTGPSRNTSGALSLLSSPSTSFKAKLNNLRPFVVTFQPFRSPCLSLSLLPCDVIPSTLGGCYHTDSSICRACQPLSACVHVTFSALGYLLCPWAFYLLISLDISRSLYSLS